METMTGLDAKFLYSETPTAHMHTVKVVVADVSALKGGFSFDALTGDPRGPTLSAPAVPPPGRAGPVGTRSSRVGRGSPSST